jgi:hypothetical protein
VPAVLSQVKAAFDVTDVGGNSVSRRRLPTIDTVDI